MSKGKWKGEAATIFPVWLLRIECELGSNVKLNCLVNELLMNKQKGPMDGGVLVYVSTAAFSYSQIYINILNFNI